MLLIRNHLVGSFVFLDPPEFFFSIFPARRWAEHASSLIRCHTRACYDRVHTTDTNYEL